MKVQFPCASSLLIYQRIKRRNFTTKEYFFVVRDQCWLNISLLLEISVGYQ